MRQTTSVLVLRKAAIIGRSDVICDLEAQLWRPVDVRPLANDTLKRASAVVASRRRVAAAFPEELCTPRPRIAAPEASTAGSPLVSGSVRNAACPVRDGTKQLRNAAPIAGLEGSEPGQGAVREVFPRCERPGWIRRNPHPRGSDGRLVLRSAIAICRPDVGAVLGAEKRDLRLFGRRHPGRVDEVRRLRGLRCIRGGTRGKHPEVTVLFVEPQTSGAYRIRRAALLAGSGRS